MNEKRVDLESLGIYSDERVIEMAGLTKEDVAIIGVKLVASTIKSLKEYDSTRSFLTEDGGPHNVHPDKPEIIARDLGYELMDKIRPFMRKKKKYGEEALKNKRL